MTRLAGINAIITGAASGIGKSTAERFVEQGAKIVVVDRDRAKLERVAAELNVEHIVGDLAQRGSPAAVVEEAVARLGGLDTLVNAAGILVSQPFETIDEDLWEQVFAVNMFGVASMCRAALPALRASSKASIINIASVNALRPSEGTSAYSASKAGVLMLSRSLAEELAPIRVNAICPGIVDTGMTEGFMSDPEIRISIAAMNALNTIGKPEDIAGVCAFLASDDARFINGAQITVDGGMTYS